MRLDTQWIIASRLAQALVRVAESISYSIPPLDEFERELQLVRFYADEIERAVKDVRRKERRNAIQLVFGKTLRPGRDK